MDQTSTWSVPTVSGHFTGEIVRLITAVGGPRFESELLRMSRRMARCDHIAVIAMHDIDSPRAMLAASTDGDGVALRVCQEYVSRFWHQDRSNDVKAPSGRVRQPAILQHIRSNAYYRRRMYSPEDWNRTGSRIAERVSLWLGGDEAIYKVCFIRNREFGSFQSREIDTIGLWADLLLSLIEKHETLSRHPLKSNDLEGCTRSVEQAAPYLTRREAEVCAGIAMGMSSEGIGLNLGIKLSTVQTHRKRAYTRLGISSQNELLKLLFARAV